LAVLKNNRPFLIPYLVFLIIGAIILALYNKADIHLYINRFHNHFSDNFFRIATMIAEGLFISVVIFLFLFQKIRNSILLISSFAFSGMLAQFFKRVIFNEMPRPKAFFENIADLHTIENVQLHTQYSFPSGHATSAFTLFFALSLFAKQPLLKLLCFIGALLVSWSRIHLSQHFFMDVYAGSVIGIVSVALIFWYFGKLENKRFNQEAWLDQGIHHLLRKK
jgi:membrane-associated phospholipid phosphatase